MSEYEEKQSMSTRFKSFVKECVRVFKITKKPTKEEFKTISKVAGLGILVIGLIGFIVHLLKVLLFN
jgi:protein transport protein SEC61 subunit gamma-like protein